MPNLPFDYRSRCDAGVGEHLKALVRTCVGDYWGGKLYRIAEIVTITRNHRGWAVAAHQCGMAMSWTGSMECTSAANSAHALDMLKQHYPHLASIRFEQHRAPSIPEAWDGLEHIMIGDGLKARKEPDWDTFDALQTRLVSGGTAVGRVHRLPISVVRSVYLVL